MFAGLVWLSSNHMLFSGNLWDKSPSWFLKTLKLRSFHSGNFKIFKNAIGQFIPNHTAKHVITSSNLAIWALRIFQVHIYFSYCEFRAKHPDLRAATKLWLNKRCKKKVIFITIHVCSILLNACSFWLAFFVSFFTCEVKFTLLSLVIQALFPPDYVWLYWQIR